MDPNCWVGMMQGPDGYPIKNKLGYYCLGGKKCFTATHLEFYSVILDTQPEDELGRFEN
jgi:hypothetical protein